MRKQMKSCRPIFRRTAAFALVACLAMENAGVPVFAEESISDQRPEEDGTDIDQKAKEQKLVGTAVDQEAKEQKLVGTAGGQEATGQKAAGTAGDQGTTEQQPAGTAGGQEMTEQQPAGIDAGQETTEQQPAGIDASQETTGQQPAGTAGGQDMTGQQPDGTNADQETKEQDPDGTDVDQEEEQESGKDTDDIEAEEKTSANEKRESVSGNDAENIEKRDQTEQEEQTEKEEQEIINVVVPTSYTLALNPYRLPVMTGEEEMTTEQIISGTYGIVNKSSTDQIVAVSLQVEDHSGEELVFVDSAEEAEHAGMNEYAIYLAAVPANGEQILIDGKPVDKTVTGESLQNVEMTGAPDQAVTLYAGSNQMSFQLSKAVYQSEPDKESGEENLDAEEEDTSESKDQPENVLKELAPDGKSVTAYTFTGVMNPNAEWEKLSGGIKLSVVYTYQTADGDEEIIEGTGAMVSGTGIKDPA